MGNHRSHQPLIQGQTYGRLTLVSPAEPKSSGQRRWHAVCNCGTPRVVLETRVRTGDTKSCGCLRDDRAKETNTAHGQHKSPIYTAWADMKTRCLSPTNPEYHCYGGRGITVCDRWMEFQAFATDIGPKPSPDLSLDRIDNNGHYEPGNCRWATRLEQLANQQKTVHLTKDGVTHHLREWARILGVTHQCIMLRLRRGWTIDDALTPK